MLVWTGMPMLVAPIAGGLSDKIGNKPFMLFGLLIQGGALLWLGLVAKPSTGYGTLVLPLIVAGIGLIAIFAPNKAQVDAAEHGSAQLVPARTYVAQAERTRPGPGDSPRPAGQGRPFPAPPLRQDQRGAC